MAARLNPLRMLLGCFLALGACWAAYRLWDEAHFAYLSASDVNAAHAARPSDAAALGKTIDGRVKREVGFSLSTAEMGAIRTAFQAEPLSRSLLRIVGMQAESQGKQARADTSLALSDAVSRRDALTQLWLIERSVQKEDMNGAIRHYHAALSVHPELGPVLFPILAKAISFPEVREALAPYLARQVNWAAGMLNIAINEGNPADVAKLVMPVGDMVRGEHYNALNARLLTQLSKTGDFATAGKLAQAIVPQLNRSALASLATNDTTTDKRLGALAWKLVDEGRILATANGAGGVDIDMDPLTRGEVASRTMPVIGGRTYVFGQTWRGGGSASDASMVLRWQAFCVPSQPRAIVWEQMLPKTRQRQRFESVIQVPAACKGLEMVLIARAPEGQQPGHATLEALSLVARPN